ncbi:MAG: glycoside hydrolase [Ignavibacteriae bacterium]|nr:glycoside hydrolase [Ignavibacteriota bacterium]
MIPLKVAILWHYHQPYYEKDGELILPWVRLHGVKDYWDLPELFHEYPDIKQTVNLVPSLNMQIDDYINDRTSDKIQRLTDINPSNLSESQKRELLRLFFLCNEENMILPNPRYKELFVQAQNKEEAMKKFSLQDWFDLQVWYNLTWFGYFSKERKPIKRLIKKGRNFSEEEKKLVMSLQIDVLRQIKNQMKMLYALGQIEISCTPLYHPILPLLCDTQSAKQSMPDLKLPENNFAFPEDAKEQIEGAVNYYKREIGIKPTGMWPSEGSVSDEVLNIMINAGLKWTASDEGVLAASIGSQYDYTEKYFPRNYISSNGEIAMLFRDHSISDAIGFLYSRWNPHDAARDFVGRLNGIRNDLINKRGEDCLNSAVVPVILDGENCWEFYQYNGLPFLKALFEELSNSESIRTVTCSTASAKENVEYLPPINSVRAGSWINADFNIWIGHKDHRKAWSMLAKARKSVEEKKPELEENILNNVMKEVYIAEGSDWFWWYGDSHIAENKNDFDVLFRWHIVNIYKLIGMEIPKDVMFPIGKEYETAKVVKQEGIVTPSIDGKVSAEDEWLKAGYYDAHGSMSAMHQVGELLQKLWYAADNNNIYLRFDLVNALDDDDSIEVQFLNPKKFQLIIRQNIFELKADDEITINQFSYSNFEIVELSFSKSTFFSDNTSEIKLELTIMTKTKEGEICYPRQGSLELVM